MSFSLLIIAVVIAGLIMAGVFAYQFLQKPVVFKDGAYAESKFIMIDGLKVHYIQEGKGPNLVLIHGIASSLFVWRHVFKELAKRYRVTAIDLPGFGGSDRLADLDCGLDAATKRLKEILNELKINKATFVAHSMGGAITAWLAHTHPEFFDKMILVSPALNPDVVFVPPKVWGFLVPTLGRLMVTKQLVRIIYLKQCLHRPPPDVELAIDEYYRPFHKQPLSLAMFHKHIFLVRDKRLRDLTWSVNIPTLLLVGARDRILPARNFKPSPRWKMVVDENSAHQMMEENPKYFLDNIFTF